MGLNLTNREERYLDQPFIWSLKEFETFYQNSMDLLHRIFCKPYFVDENDFYDIYDDAILNLGYIIEGKTTKWFLQLPLECPYKQNRNAYLMLRTIFFHRMNTEFKRQHTLRRIKRMIKADPTCHEEFFELRANKPANIGDVFSHVRNQLNSGIVHAAPRVLEFCHYYEIALKHYRTPGEIKKFIMDQMHIDNEGNYVKLKSLMTKFLRGASGKDISPD